jgi:hypothetical protein
MKKSMYPRFSNLIIKISNFFSYYAVSYKESKINSTFNYIFKDLKCPLPYSFCTPPKKSTLEIDLSSILLDISNILPQYSHFIELFKSTIIETDANVIIDGGGNMSIDVSSNMSDNEATQLSKKLNIIDSLIRSRSDEIEKLLQDANRIENELALKNPEYKSQILSKAQEFQRLKNSYKD